MIPTHISKVKFLYKKQLMIVSLIAAAAENNVIGKDNDLIWHLPEDLKHFKRTTSGHTVISGRKTYESYGKPLPKRKNIIITRDSNYEAEGCIVVHSLEEALELVKEEEEVFIIGGGEIYRQALPVADRIYLTRVHAKPEGDACFPEFSSENWEEKKRREFPADEKHDYAFTIIWYERKA